MITTIIYKKYIIYINHLTLRLQLTNISELFNNNIIIYLIKIHCSNILKD